MFAAAKIEEKERKIEKKFGPNQRTLPVEYLSILVWFSQTTKLGNTCLSSKCWGSERLRVCAGMDCDCPFATVISLNVFFPSILVHLIARISARSAFEGCLAGCPKKCSTFAQKRRTISSECYMIFMITFFV
eukprot:gnl/MRDRNA2_/MRDRNA2_188654_c0_seq1.p1 gnl/MRDRNA2_/MRDRNA2_188654_c0~~gnl/MRDRNA2_/MRDRNA2_188654_c0_seq1.p1  ORF type:complete len:141 (-),score=9.99 gnl/MRDRNA2_/MRDRNA2_188654_c0_seq1:104-499(-)